MLAFELRKFSGPNILSHAKKDRQIIWSYFAVGHILGVVSATFYARRSKGKRNRPPFGTKEKWRNSRDPIEKFPVNLFGTKGWVLTNAIKFMEWLVS